MQSEPVIIPQPAYAAIVAHARAGKPEEICGVLRGKGLTAFEAIAGRNIATERIENYEVDPHTLLLQFKFEDAGEEMMGIYHSHPVSVAYPSATDAWNAHYPECIYFICSLEFDDAPVVRAFRMVPHFVDLDVANLAATLEFYETRAGLFAYYQAADASVPPALADLPAAITAPFYVVYFAPGGDAEGTAEGLEEAEGRVVTLAEHPVQVVTSVEAA
ncbi:MAG: M67 family metallopeptidase [Litorilinea sp.]